MINELKPSNHHLFKHGLAPSLEVLCAFFIQTNEIEQRRVPNMDKVIAIEASLIS
jgi:hypothetical protein